MLKNLFHCTKKATLQIQCYCGGRFLRILWQGDKGENFPENKTKVGTIIYFYLIYEYELNVNMIQEYEYMNMNCGIVSYFYLIYESQSLRDWFKTKYCTFCDRMQNILKI